MRSTKIIRIICILLAGGFYLALVKANLYSAGFLTLIEYLFAIPFIVLAIFSFIRDISDYRKTKNKTELLPTIIVCVFIIIISSMKIVNAVNENSPTVIRLENNPFEYSRPHFIMELKENKTFTLTAQEADFAAFYYGNYIIKDSIINLDYSDMNEKIISHQLLRKKEMSKEKPDSLITNYYQLNDKSKTIDTMAISFHIVE